MFDLKDGTANISMLYALYRAWCEKNNECRVTLGVEIDGSGGLDGWDDEKYNLLSWESIEDGCKQLAGVLKKETICCIP